MTRPELAIVVDTEEEFDWTLPFDRANTGTTNIAAQVRAHAIYDRFGIVPTYVVGYPIATDRAAVSVLAGLERSGRAEIGAHLHPWVTPPHEEEVTTRNSYHGNLPPALERAKLEVLTNAVADAFGKRPTVFKAGRYGFGPATAAALKTLGYAIDCSFVPHACFAGDGGPSYRDTPDQPFWLDAEETLLEVPLTSGFFGHAAGAGRHLHALFDSPRAARLRLPGLLARSGLLSRARLTPEGVPAAEQCRLIAAMAARGRRFFTLTYHSPSLLPGNTPYVRDAADLDAFLGAIETVLAYFRDEMGGAFTTLTQHRAGLVAARRQAAA